LQITLAVTCYYLAGYGFFNIFKLKALARGTTFYFQTNLKLSYAEIKEIISDNLKQLNNNGFGCFEILPIKN
jgi:hypothetical protein